MATTQTGAKRKAVSREYRINGSKLMKLFENSLKDIYWSEKALIKALPKMAKKAASEELVEVIENHLTETEEQVQKVEQVFTIIGKKAVAKKSVAMSGLLKELDEMLKGNVKGLIRDAGIIAATQKVEHYEIASYGTLHTFAQTLQLNEAILIFEEILNEEKTADETLTEVAASNVRDV